MNIRIIISTDISTDIAIKRSRPFCEIERRLPLSAPGLQLAFNAQGGSFSFRHKEGHNRSPVRFPFRINRLGARRGAFSRTDSARASSGAEMRRPLAITSEIDTDLKPGVSNEGACDRLRGNRGFELLPPTAEMRLNSVQLALEMAFRMMRKGAEIPTGERDQRVRENSRQTA